VIQIPSAPGSRIHLSSLQITAEVREGGENDSFGEERFLMGFLCPRPVGVIGANINVRSSYSQWEPMNVIQTQVFMTASPAF